MKILTLGASPCLVTSLGKIHSLILKHLYFTGHSVVSAVWGHDVTFFVPEIKEDGSPQYFYDFKFKDDKHQVPLIPINHDIVENNAKMTYELIRLFKPDMIITVGDITDFLYMKAVKMFQTEEVKWFAVLVNHSYPLNESHQEILKYMDGVLCVNRFSFDMIREFFLGGVMEWSYVGINPFSFTDHNLSSLRDGNKFRLMASGNNCQSDNLPAIMEGASLARESIPNLELYIHSSTDEAGDYNLLLLRDRFDPGGEFIVFPSKYTSIFEGYSSEDYRKELISSDVFVSTSMAGAAGLGFFDAIASGCIPLFSDIPIFRELIEGIEGDLNGYSKEELLIPTARLMTVGEKYLGICDPKEVRKKIIGIYAKLPKNRGYNETPWEVISNHSQKKFLEKISDMVLAIRETSTALCLDTC